MRRKTRTRGGRLKFEFEMWGREARFRGWSGSRARGVEIMKARFVMTPLSERSFFA